MPPTRLTRGAPYFPVRDVTHTLRHYTDVLGFELEYGGGDPLEFAIVARDGLPVMLRRVDPWATIVPSERQGGTWDAFFWVEGIQNLAEELRAAGAEIVYGPVRQPYGVDEMAVRDPDGHVLGFGEAGPAPRETV